ncbi:MAG: hypothetical protein ACTHQ3_15765 [Motilibacteraceae bacterium]
MDQHTEATAVDRRRRLSNWCFGIGVALLAWALVGALSNGSRGLPAVGWLVGLLGLVLLAVGLLRRP